MQKDVESFSLFSLKRVNVVSTSYLKPFWNAIRSTELSGYLERHERGDYRQFILGYHWLRGCKFVKKLRCCVGGKYNKII